MREAVKALEMVRVLDVRRGDGTYVTSLEPRLLLEGLGLAVDLLQDESVLSVVEVRRLLEPAATGLAAERITDEGLARIEERLREMDEAGSDAERQVAADAAFHLEVFTATRNQTLLSILDGLSSLTLRARIWRAVVEGDAITETLQQHRAIFSALAARDRPLAEAAALMHVTTSENWLRNVMVEKTVDGTSEQ
jgi:GntR family transcriptional repressor for pyruvate dehydrogenase complex